MDQRTVMVIRMARFARENIWPEAGGLLDQPAWFVSAMEFVTGEDQTLESRQMQRELRG